MRRRQLANILVPRAKNDCRHLQRFLVRHERVRRLALRLIDRRHFAVQWAQGCMIGPDSNNLDLEALLVHLQRFGVPAAGHELQGLRGPRFFFREQACIVVSLGLLQRDSHLCRCQVTPRAKVGRAGRVAKGFALDWRHARNEGRQDRERSGCRVGLALTLALSTQCKR